MKSLKEELRLIPHLLLVYQFESQLHCQLNYWIRHQFRDEVYRRFGRPLFELLQEQLEGDLHEISKRRVAFLPPG